MGAVTKEEFEREANRVDRRIETVTGALEDRMIGRMAEMESRIMRHMDQRFEEMAATVQEGYQHLDQKMMAEIGALKTEMRALKHELKQEMNEFKQELLAALAARPPRAAD